jgi:hypothetical protein
MQDRQTLLQIMYAPPAFLPRMSAVEIHERIENIKNAKKTMRSNLDWFQLDGYQKHLQEKLNQLIK